MIEMGHHSGRYDNFAVTAGFAALRDRCSILSHTEFANNRRSGELKQAVDKAGWEMWQRNTSPYDETCFTWNKSIWRKLRGTAVVISDVPWYSASTGNRMPRFTASAVLLEHQGDGAKWAFITCHTPSHIATWHGFRPSSSNRVECYHDGTKNLGKWVEILTKAWEQNGLVVAADWNAPVEQKWFRDYLEGRFPERYAVCGPNDDGYPDTHDARCIDWAILGGNVRRVGPTETYQVPDSDHHSAVFALDKKK